MSLEDHDITARLRRQRGAFYELVAQFAELEEGDHAEGRCTEDCVPCGLEELRAKRLSEAEARLSVSRLAELNAERGIGASEEQRQLFFAAIASRPTGGWNKQETATLTQTAEVIFDTEGDFTLTA